jgi:hypothetical protein
LGCHALFNDDVLARLRNSSPIRVWVNRLALPAAVEGTG